MKQNSYLSYSRCIWIEILGLALLAPYILNLYQDDFEVAKWETWVRIAPFGLAVLEVISSFPSIINQNKCGLKFTAAVYFLGLWLISFIIVFGIQPNTFESCVEFEQFCLESESCSGSGSDAWRSLIYIAGLCVILSAQILSLNVLITKLQDRTGMEVSDDIKSQNSLESDIHLKNENIVIDRPLPNTRDQPSRAIASGSTSRQDSQVLPLSRENLSRFEAENSFSYQGRNQVRPLPKVSAPERYIDTYNQEPTERNNSRPSMMAFQQPHPARISENQSEDPVVRRGGERTKTRHETSGVNVATIKKAY